MNYKITKNKIKIFSKDDFRAQDILECGQIFAYKVLPDGYQVFSQDKEAKVVETADGYEIITISTEYFKNFFDLDTDYAAIKKRLSKFEILKEPLRFGSGIRILKNDVFEMVVSFIISANNNIKRIQKIIFSLRDQVAHGKAFPTQEQLCKLTVEDFYKLGLGYRAPQLYKALRQFSEAELHEWQSLATPLLRKKLISISGIGPKVADCILLFGYGRKDVFPVDTWIYKMYNKFYSPLENREKIRQNFVNIFGDLSGYAQQYLFYYQRSSN